MICRSRSWFALSSLLASLPAQAPAAEGVLRRVGDHFVVEFHAEGLPASLANRLADESLVAAESVWPTLAKLLRPGPDLGGTIHVHAAVAPFEALENKHSPNKIHIGAFLRSKEREGHVLVWPRLSDQVLERVGLPKTTIENIALHAAQLIAAACEATPTGDAWFAEVVAFHVLESVSNAIGKCGIDPDYDTRRWHAYGWRSNQMVSLEKLVRDVDDPPDLPAWKIQKGSRALIAHFLAAAGGPSWARKLLGKTKQATDGQPAARVAAVAATVGADWAKTEHAFAKLCKTLVPVWFVQHPEFLRQGKQWLLVGDGRMAAMVCTPGALPRGDYVIRVTLTVEDVGRSPPRFQLDWDKTTLIAVSLLADAVVVTEMDQNSRQSEVLRTKANFVMGRAFDVALEVDGQQLRVVVDGVEVLVWPYGKRGMRGEWCLCAGDLPLVVESLRIEPLAPRKKPR